MNNEYLNTGLVPLKMCSAIVSFDQNHPDWPLAEIESCATPEPRSFECFVGFEDPFSNVPLVHAGIVGFDIDNRDTNRLRMRISEISNRGFNLVLQTWMHTRVYQVDVSWIALGGA